MFQLIWNAVPTCLECEHHIAETRREVKKLCIRAYFGVCKYLSLSMFFDFPWRVKVYNKFGVLNNMPVLYNK